MKNIIKFFAVILIASSFIGCDGFMDVVPTDVFAEDLVFGDAALAQAFVTQLYNDIRHQALEHSTDGLTDDAYFTHNYGQRAVNEATISPSNMEWFNNDNAPWKWDFRYSGIRNANLVIARIAEVPDKPGFDKVRMRGEAHYLRAHMYHELLRAHGGVPIVDLYEMKDTVQMRAARSTVGEVLAYILADLEEAEKYLTETVPSAMQGRVTKFAATGLKARIQLHVASALYADRTINTLACNQYTGDRAALYRAARTAAIKVIDEGPFKLIDCTAGVTAFDRGELFKAIITDKTNSEQMFVRNFGIDAGDRNRMGLWHGPNGFYNWAGTTPTQDLVMAFEFEDGSMPAGMTLPGEYAVGNPYNGREPRFYATVATDGNPWGRPRSTAGAVYDPTPLGNLQAGTYELSTGGDDKKIDILGPNRLPDGTFEILQSIEFKGIAGVDTRQGPIEDWNGSWTGYYERKLIDCAVNAMADPQPVPWTFMRLAEMYLIAAEASVELGELEEAEKYVNFVRERVGNVDARTALAAQGKSFTQEGLRELIRHECRVEFAYEGHRFFDVRRWMIADQTNIKPLTGIKVIGRLKPGATQGRPYVHNEDLYTYYYYVNPLGQENRAWHNKMYFVCIHRDEMLRNPSLVNNPLY